MGSLKGQKIRDYDKIINENKCPLLSFDYLDIQKITTSVLIDQK